MARNKKGEQIYSRRYRKQTKSGMLHHVKNRKKYEYLPQLMEDIITSRKESVVGVKHKESIPHDHPQRIQQTIAHQPPVHTKDIVITKKSRFVNDHA